MRKGIRTRVHVAVLALLACGVLSTSCTGLPSPPSRTLPKPGGIKDSLLLILLQYQNREYTGPELVEITVERRDGKVLRRRHMAGSGRTVPIRLRPGSYTLRSIEMTTSPRKEDDELRTYSRMEAGEDFVIGASTVLLYESKIVSSPEGISLTPLEAEDRRTAAKRLAGRIRFLYWSGGSYVGFGPHSPDEIFSPLTYPVAISSEPERAAVRIDGDEYGRTPLSVELSSGKHMLRLVFPGGQERRRMITVPGEKEILIRGGPEGSAGSESPEGGRAAADGPEESGIAGTGGGGRSAGEEKVAMVVPFLNRGSQEYDYLATVFSDSLAVTLSGYEGIRAFAASGTVAGTGETGTGSSSAGGGSEGSGETGAGARSVQERLSRLFAAAEAAGADLLIDGSYRTGEEQVFVESLVYDVKTEMAKTSTLYTGRAGLDVFDSIDEMAASFAEEVDRVLPDIGEKVIQMVEAQDEESLRFRRRVAGKKIEAQRNERRILIDAGLGSGASILDRNFDVEGDSHRGMEMIIGPLFSCTYLPLPYLGMTAMSGYEQLPGAHTPAFEIPLIAGPTAYFPTPSFDLVFGVLPHLAYCSGFREGGSSYEATWRGDLLVDWGIIFYRYGSLGEPINYFRIDLQLSFLSGSWNRDFGDPQEAGPNSRLYFAIGRRL